MLAVALAVILVAVLLVVVAVVAAVVLLVVLEPFVVAFDLVASVTADAVNGYSQRLRGLLENEVLENEVQT